MNVPSSATAPGRVDLAVPAARIVQGVRRYRVGDREIDVLDGVTLDFAHR